MIHYTCLSPFNNGKGKGRRKGKGAVTLWWLSLVLKSVTWNAAQKTTWGKGKQQWQGRNLNKGRAKAWKAKQILGDLFFKTFYYICLVGLLCCWSFVVVVLVFLKENLIICKRRHAVSFVLSNYAGTAVLVSFLEMGKQLQLQSSLGVEKCSTREQHYFFCVLFKWTKILALLPVPRYWWSLFYMPGVFLLNYFDLEMANPVLAPD